MVSQRMAFDDAKAVLHRNLGPSGLGVKNPFHGEAGRAEIF